MARLRKKALNNHKISKNTGIELMFCNKTTWNILFNLMKYVRTFKNEVLMKSNSTYLIKKNNL